MATGEKDEPLTPAGQLFLQPKTTQIINCVLGSRQPWNIDRDIFRSTIANSVMIKHPRFTSLLVTDRHGHEHWRKTQVNIDDHIIVRQDRLSDKDDEEDDDVVNDYLADLSVSTPLSTEKPLWEVHLLSAHNCVIIRVHHALGDGISLMSLLLTCCRKVDDPENMPTISSVGKSSSKSSSGRRRGHEKLWKWLKMMWYTLVYVLEFVMRVLWKRDTKTAVSGGEGVELWPRKLATARFRMDDMKTVKKAGIDATINDVLFAVISAGLSKYLDMQSPKDLREGLQMTGAAMVNLRPQPGLQELKELMTNKSGTRWGNKFGMILLPVFYHKSGRYNPLHYLKTAKKMLDRKKLSLEAYFSYKIGYIILKSIGVKAASLANYRIIRNTTFTISNVMGPMEKIMIAGAPVDYMRASSSALPHAITMHMLSYAGTAEMQILVAKDIIPDPKVLAKCLEDALLELKAAALAVTKSE